MTTPPSDSGNKHQSFARYFLVTWATSVVVAAAVVLGVIKPLERIGLLEGIEIAGEDAAMRVYAMSGHDLKDRIVVVWIDGATKKMWEDANTTVGERLPDLLHLVAKKAAAVVIDVELAAGVSADAKTRLAEEFTKTNARIVAPFQELRLTHGDNEWGVWPDWIDRRGVSGNVVRAAALLSSDTHDGLVRHLTSGVCVSIESGQSLRVPSLAEAAVEPPQRPVACEPETADDNPPLILFQKEDLGDSAIRTTSASELIDKDGKPLSSPKSWLLNGAFIVIGQTDAEASADQHQTPLGAMPGALVTAHSIFTIEKGQQTHSDKLLYESFLIAVLGCVFASVKTGIERMGPQRPQSSPVEGATGAASGWLRFGLDLGGLALYFVMAAGLVAIIWTFMAARALAEGVVFGTFAPVLAIALETLMEVGQALVESVRDGVTWLFAKIGGAAVLLVAAVVFLAMLGSAYAKEKAGRLTLPDVKADVILVRANESVRPEGLVWELDSFDTVRIGPGTAVHVELLGHPSEVLRGPDILHVGPPPRTGLAALWDAFWGLPLNRAETYAQGITVVPRGVRDAPVADPSAVIAAGGDMARALPVAGPLRLPSTFPSAGYLTTDLSGLALTWLGGTPPYDIVAEDQDGATIAEFRSETAFLWRPDWRAPAAGTRLRISDANDRVLHIGLTPSPKPPAIGGADPLADAIDLFETEPAWRFEALRRIARLAGGDPTAAQAVLAIRLAE
jgi:hypothetical protein